MCSRPAVSRMTVSSSAFLAWATALRQTSTGDGRRRFAVDRHADLLAEHLELIDGGGPLQVGGDQQRLAAALAQHQGELAGRGRLALALQAAEHEDGRPILGEGDVRIDRPHQLDQFVVDDLDDLLAGVEGAQHFLADGALRDLGR